MAVNNDALVFELPDGNTVSLITWGYVLNKLETPLTSITTSISSINQSLQQISDRLDDWIDVNNA